MRKLTAADLKRMREQRTARVNAIKDDANNRTQEYLLTANLPKGVELWYPEGDEAQEVMFRISDFEVLKEGNIAGEDVGSFGSMRHIHVHKLPNKKMVICPRDYGRDCPLCNAVHDHYEEIKNNPKHPLVKFKAKRVTLFNALFKVAGADGKVRTVPRVVRGGSFFLTNAFNEALSEEEQFHKDNSTEIYAFSDLEMGYWIKARFGLKSAVAGNDKKYMQMLSAELQWHTKSPVPEGAYPYIVDLDSLIPPAPSYDELAQWLGDTSAPKATEKPAETTVDNIDIGADAEDTIDCGPTEPPAEETIDLETEEVDSIPEDTAPFEEPKVEKKPEAKPVKKAKAVKEEPKKEVVIAEDEPTVGGDDFDSEFSDADFGDDFE